MAEQSDNNFGTEKIMSEEGESLKVSKRIIMSGDNLIDAQPRLDNQLNQPIVFFTLDRLGAQKFGKATTENVGKRLAIVLDDKIISAPSIREPITGGSGTISDLFISTSYRSRFIAKIRALFPPIKIVEERTVGPDLGEDRLNQAQSHF